MKRYVTPILWPICTFHHCRDAFVPATNHEAQTHAKRIWLVASPRIIKNAAILQCPHLMLCQTLNLTSFIYDMPS